MSTLNARGRPRLRIWTVADLYRRFGPIAFERIRHDPPPGAGTVEDVGRLNDHEDRLCELVDGVLVAKTVDFRDSVIATNIGYLLSKTRGQKRAEEERPAIREEHREAEAVIPARETARAAIANRSSASLYVFEN
jgi:hypothetical protein